MCYQAWHTYENTFTDSPGSMFISSFSILPCSEVDKNSDHHGYVIVKKNVHYFNLFTEFPILKLNFMFLEGIGIS